MIGLKEVSAMRQYAVLVVVLASACAPPVRFQDRAILWREPDTRPSPQPKSNEVWFDYVGIRDAMYLPANRELRIDYGRESTNVNALDEVPDSTWFADPRRVTDPNGAVRGMRSFTLDQMERGGMLDDAPPEPPFTIIKGKGAGANLGFQVRDKRGRKYLFKMDPPGLVGMDTSTEVVVTRLAWAAGWNVPAECIVDFSREDLKLAPTAKTRLVRVDADVQLTEDMLERMLNTVPTLPDGRIRVVASRWIEGKILGPFAYFGRRIDDRNDLVKHEDRRDLRAFGMFSMWVNNIDTLETNTLDSYVGKPGEGHVIHYQQDVGGSFGARAEEPVAWWMANDIYLAPSRILASLVTLGIVRRPWDDEQVRLRRARNVGQYPELGNFEWEHFEPSTWHPVLDNPAFERQTPRDTYWGMKRVLAFNEEELRGAIKSGRYRPAAEERLYEILWKRREKMARVYLSKVAALDYFRFEREALCFDDLWVKEGFGGQLSMQYLVAGEGVAPPKDASGASQCVPLRPREGYRIVGLTVQRPGERHPQPAVRVHFVEQRGVRRLVGIERLD
jgi:hypothetical protein